MASLLDKAQTRSFVSFKEMLKKDNNSKEKTNGEQITSIPISLIVSNTNIRSEYINEDLNELAESMKTHGQLQPIQVYEHNIEYEIIFGHRRYLAAKKAGLIELNCIIVDKPSDIEIVYRQVIENEQSKTLSAKDREAYIKKLRDMGESFNDIAKKIGKTEQWIRQCAIAAEIREENQLVLNGANIGFGTADLHNLRNASKEEIDEAIQLSIENPEQKKSILSNINKRTKKKYNVGGKRKSTTKIKNNEVELNSLDNQKTENLISTSDNLLIGFRIIRNEKEKTISITKEHSADLTDFQVNSVLGLLYRIYKEKGYNKINKV